MKQLVNKYDKRIRLVGLDDAEINGREVEFWMPMAGNAERCCWRATDWDIADYGRQPKKKGECAAFRTKLEAAIKHKGFSASGLGVALGKSTGWLNMVLKGKRLLPRKYDSALEDELGLTRGILTEWRAEKP